MTFDIKPFDAAHGAEVHGLDLSSRLIMKLLNGSSALTTNMPCFYFVIRKLMRNNI